MIFDSGHDLKYKVNPGGLTLKKLQSGITFVILILQPLFFLKNMHCLIIKVRCKFDQNQTKLHKLSNKNLEMLMGGCKDRKMERLKIDRHTI